MLPKAAAEVEQQLQEQWPSLDEVYAEVKDAIVVQRDRVKTIDTKANFGLTAATLLTAGVTGLGRALAESGQDAAAAETLLEIDIRIDQVVDWDTSLSNSPHGWATKRLPLHGGRSVSHSLARGTSLCRQ